MTPVGIEPATFRFLAQHLNHCALFNTEVIETGVISQVFKVITCSIILSFRTVFTFMTNVTRNAGNFFSIVDIYTDILSSFSVS